MDVEFGLRMQDGGKIQSFASLGLANRRAQQPAKKKHKQEKHKKDKNRKEKRKKTQTHKRQTQKGKYKRDKHKKNYKTYLRLIRVPGGEGRGSGKRKKLRVIQLR